MSCTNCLESDDYVLAEYSGDFGGNDAQPYLNWTSRQLANHVEKAGLKSYTSMIITHKITGKVAPLLTDADLKEMGMTVVGDRMRFKQLILSLGRRARCAGNETPLWTVEEQKYYTPFEQHICTLCGIFPNDPTTYKLTNSTLKIKRVNPVRYGSFKCICCYEYSAKSIDLARVKEAEVLPVAAPFPQRVCCCADGSDLVVLHPTENNYNSLRLKVPHGQGQLLCKMILTQVEKNQVMDRD